MNIKRCKYCGCPRGTHPDDGDCMMCGHGKHEYEYDPNSIWNACPDCRHLDFWHHKEDGGCVADECSGSPPKPKSRRMHYDSFLEREVDSCSCTRIFESG